MARRSRISKPSRDETQRERVIGYARVSTDGQAADGVSLVAQRAKIEQYASLYDLDLVGVIEDTGSGKTLQRQGLQEALALLADGRADSLLVTKLDRLTRSVRDLGELIETAFAQGRSVLRSVGDQIDTSSAAGRLVLHVLASVSQWEREAIGERTTAALAYKRQLGERCGEIPYGHRLAEDGKTLKADPGEQALIAALRDARQRGLSQRATLAELTRQGFVTRRGTQLSLVQVQRVMARNLIA